MAIALAFLHEHGIAHRDVHVGNIMLSSDGKSATLVDLDLACKPTSPHCTALCYGKSTPSSTPPDLWCSEKLLARKIDTKQWFAGDVWALASAMASLRLMRVRIVQNGWPYTHGRVPSECQEFWQDPVMKTQMQQRIADVSQTMGNDNLSTLVHRMLALDWKKRPTAVQVLLSLEQCAAKDRDDFAMPDSPAEFEKKLSSGEISPSGEYYF